MLPLNFDRADGRPLDVLCLGAHCDDIEIGCGGAVLRLVESELDVRFHWTTLCSTEERRREALASARSFLGKETEADIVVEGLQDSFLPAQWREAKQVFERLKAELRPDLIFTTCRNDLHQDHRVVSELTWNTFRDHMILEYEVAKYDADLGSPNFFVQLSEELVRRKCDLIVQGFPSQSGRSWWDPETFRSLLRIRGIESNAPDGYAEGFYARKLVLG